MNGCVAFFNSQRIFITRYICSFRTSLACGPGPVTATFQVVAVTRTLSFPQKGVSKKIEPRMHTCSFFVLLSLPIACLAWSVPIASNFPSIPALGCRLRGGSGASGVKMGVEVRGDLAIVILYFLLRCTSHGAFTKTSLRK
jgi:hypothetical protein